MAAFRHGPQGSSLSQRTLRFRQQSHALRTGLGAALLLDGGEDPLLSVPSVMNPSRSRSKRLCC